jgi:hydroxypyruvate isomerase
MLKFDANLTLLFQELAFLDRFEAAAVAGFSGVEFLFPYDFSSKDIKTRLDRHGLELVLHNLPPGNWDAGERGIACLPDRVSEFKESVLKALEVGTHLGVKRLNCLSGIVPKNLNRQKAHDTFVANLDYAADQAAKAGIEILIEPINRYDIPDFFLYTTQQALDLISLIGQPNLRLQYDIYHAQRTEGELANTITRALPHISHIQLADNPGRHEPGTGEINWRFLFSHLETLGYQGWLGCEYRPKADTLSGLQWMHLLPTQASRV